jgi:outer membrane protein OmpA-like peptidoglycan-associated protein
MYASNNASVSLMNAVEFSPHIIHRFINLLHLAESRQHKPALLYAFGIVGSILCSDLIVTDNPFTMRRILPGLVICILFFANTTLAQTLNGMSTGNYAGISGLNFNPASIVDSRFKFDLNIASAQYFFTNNYFDAKPLTFARQLLKKSPYNSSYEAVKNDLLKPIEPSPSGVVKARVNSEFQLPLSFMLTTGKRSAIALNLRNRYELMVNNLNPLTADMFYSELDNKELHGVAMRNDGFTQGFMNWQEIGFTYGRVLLNANKHFLKAAVTAKWLGGNAASYIQADNLSVTFQDANTMSLSSPRIQYARTVRADFDLFTRRALFSNLEAQSVGWDVGFVYEFRGRVGNFKYTDEDYKSRLRRDKNKYTFRIGVALNDVGSLKYDRLPLTRDHSANINAWNFINVKANNLRDWDTAYSKQVSYISGADSTFSIGLPTAYIANVDLHLFGGFYVNAAVQRQLPNFAKSSLVRINSGEFFAVTPRFEGRHFGLYIPIILRPEETQIGATIRLGPLYVGSNNLMALIQNPLVPTADVHAGFRIPIGFGKPSKLARSIQNKSGIPIYDEYEKELDSTRMKQNSLESRLALLEKMMDSTYRNPPTVIVNNFISDSLGTRQVQTAIEQKQTGTTRSAQPSQTTPTYSQAQVDSTNAEIEKMREQAKKELKKEGVEQPKEPKKKKDGTKSSAKSEKKAKKAEERYRKENEQYNKAIEEELKKMRRQEAVTSAALVGAVSANAVVNANNNGNTQTIRDTVIVEKLKRDTLIIRDTIRIEQPTPNKADLKTDAAVVNTGTIQVPELRTARIYFASGSAIIIKNYTQVLNQVAAWMLQNPDRRVLLTGLTDATGSPEANKVLAQKRINAVKNALVSRGLDGTKFEENIQLNTSKTKQPSASNRRVDLSAIQ